MIQKPLAKPEPKHAEMLVISRKASESLVIGDRIVVTVVEIRGDKVQLGIEVPRDVSVHRTEVAAARGVVAPGRAAADNLCPALEREIAELTTQLAAKRIELAALRQGEPPER